MQPLARDIWILRVDQYASCRPITAPIGTLLPPIACSIRVIVNYDVLNWVAQDFFLCWRTNQQRSTV